VIPDRRSAGEESFDLFTLTLSEADSEAGRVAARCGVGRSDAPVVRTCFETRSSS
jgi:hypothetical protein